MAFPGSSISRFFSVVEDFQFHALQYHLVAADHAGAEITAAPAEQVIGFCVGLDPALAATYDNIRALYSEFGIRRDRTGGCQRVGMSQQIGLDARQWPNSQFDPDDLARATFTCDCFDLFEQGHTDRKLVHWIVFGPCSVGCSNDLDEFDSERQCQPRERMIGVQCN